MIQIFSLSNFELNKTKNLLQHDIYWLQYCKALLNIFVSHYRPPVVIMMPRKTIILWPLAMKKI